MNIPKNMIHIWIGPNQAPIEWMNTWKEKHPDWNYQVFHNGSFKVENFRTEKQIKYYMGKGLYAGAADLIRYELLYKYGGFIPPADAICLNNTDELWNKPKDFAYTVYESETLRPGYVSPIYACNPGNRFVKEIIDRLSKLERHQLRTPWKTTGNKFLADLIEEIKPEKLEIFPSHYFIPLHFEAGNRYDGPDKIYADQMWGTTKKRYKKAP